MIIEKNQKKRILSVMAAAIICLLAGFLMIQPGSAYAAQTDEETVLIGYYENEVFQEGAKAGEAKNGYAYEYYLKLSEYTGWKYEYVYGSFSDLYQMLLDGKIDLLAGLAWKEDREELIGYPDQPMGDETYNLVKHGSDMDITTDPASLSGKTIGVLDSAMKDVLNRFLTERNVKARVKLYQDYKTLFSDFDSGKLDVLAAEGDGAYGRKDAEIVIPFGESDYYLCVNHNRPDLLKELNTAQEMLSVEEPNYIYSLKTKYYPSTFSAMAFSAAEKTWLDEHSQLRIGYMEDYMPYSDTDAQGNVTGIVKDMTAQILKQLGIDDLKVDYQGYQSFDDMIADITADKIDAAFPVGGGYYYSEENGIHQSNPVVSVSTQLVFRDEYSEDTARHFAVNENNRMQYYYVLTHFPDSEISMYPSIDDCLDAVLAGEVGCTTLNGLRANDILKNSKYRKLSMQQLAQNDDRCYGVRIGNEGLLKILNRGINLVGADFAQSIAHRYTSELYTYTIKDFIMDHLALFVLLILAIAAIIISFLARDIRRSKKEVREKESARRILEEKNQELAQSREALSNALDEAESANRAKTAFLNNMSHDMRTPMNAIVGFTDLAVEHADDSEQVRNYLDMISVSSQHLLSLINDVLDMSRIESGNLNIEEQNVDLKELINDIRLITQTDAESKNLALSIDTEGIQHGNVAADRLRLSQVLLNILSNAVKFTPDGGTIQFTAEERPSDSEDTVEYVFRIKDNGIGMSEEFRKTIFDAFTRERTTTVSGIQGTGLGMAITKSIIDKMGGSITVHSEEGKGSEFIVSLPFKVMTAPKSDELKTRAPEEKKEHDFTGKRVLLVEDNEMNQMIATSILEKTGVTIDIAENGQVAVDKVKAADAGYYDIILMDVQMPVMDGYEATRQIRALEDPGKAEVPIVAVTANAFEEDRKITMEAGMNDHLSKPYDVPAIMKTMSNLITTK